MSIEQVVIIEFLEKYSAQEHEDRVLNHVQEKFGEWIQLFSPNEKAAVLEMIKCFSYYSGNTVRQFLVDLSNRLRLEFDLDLNSALFTYIKKENGRICSSVDYWTDFRRINNLPTENCIDDLNSFPEECWKRVNNVVIIDDCCNTGSSLEEYIKKSTKNFEGKSVFFVVICSMQAANEKLQDLGEEIHATIHLVSAEIQDKAFLKAEINRCCSADCFSRFSTSLGIPLSYSLGKYSSQSLMAFYNNTPNNTIGAFWYPTEKNDPIFERHFRRTPPWAMQEDKAKRVEENYQAAKKRGQYE